MKTLSGLFKNSFKKHKGSLEAATLLDQMKTLLFFCVYMKHPVAVFNKKLFFRIQG